MRSKELEPYVGKHARVKYKGYGFCGDYIVFITKIGNMGTTKFVEVSHPVQVFPEVKDHCECTMAYFYLVGMQTITDATAEEIDMWGKDAKSHDRGVEEK